MPSSLRSLSLGSIAGAAHRAEFQHKARTPLSASGSPKERNGSSFGTGAAQRPARLPPRPPPAFERCLSMSRREVRSRSGALQCASPPTGERRVVCFLTGRCLMQPPASLT